MRIPNKGTPWLVGPDGAVRPATQNEISEIWFRHLSDIALAVETIPPPAPPQPPPPFSANIQFQDDDVDVGLANPRYVSFDANLTATFDAPNNRVRVTATGGGSVTVPVLSDLPGRTQSFSFPITATGASGNGIAAGAIQPVFSALTTYLRPDGSGPLGNFFRGVFTGTIGNEDYGMDGGGNGNGLLVRGDATNQVSCEINHTYGWGSFAATQATMFAFTSTARSDGIFNAARADGNITGNGRLVDLFGFVADATDTTWSFVNRAGNTGAATKINTGVLRNAAIGYHFQIRLSSAGAAARIYTLNVDGTETLAYEIIASPAGMPALTPRHFYSVWFTNGGVTSVTMQHMNCWGYSSIVEIDL